MELILTCFKINKNKTRSKKNLKYVDLLSSRPSITNSKKVVYFYQLFQPLLTPLCLLLQRLPEFISNPYNLAIILLLFLAYIPFSMLSINKLVRLFKRLKNFVHGHHSKVRVTIGTLFILGGLSLSPVFIYFLYSVDMYQNNHSGLASMLSPVILQLYNIYTGLTILCCVWHILSIFT